MSTETEKLRGALANLVTFMVQTCDADKNVTGILIETPDGNDVIVNSREFYEAWARALRVLSGLEKL